MRESEIGESRSDQERRGESSSEAISRDMKGLEVRQGKEAGWNRIVMTPFDDERG